MAGEIRTWRQLDANRYARQRLKAGETPTTKSAIAMHPAAPRLQTGACERDCGNGAGRSPRECLPKRAPFLSPRRTEIGAHFLPRGGLRSGSRSSSRFCGRLHAGVMLEMHLTDDADDPQGLSPRRVCVSSLAVV